MNFELQNSLHFFVIFTNFVKILTSNAYIKKIIVVCFLIFLYRYTDIRITFLISCIQFSRIFDGALIFLLQYRKN